MNESLTIAKVREIKQKIEADILVIILTMEEQTGCRIESIDIHRSFITTGKRREIGLDSNVTLKMRI